MKKIILLPLCLLFSICCNPAVSVGLTTISKDPYIGTIVVDVATGQVISEDSADAPIYPASVIKLMDLLIILEKIEAGKLKLTDQVFVTAEASRIGGSQVYLKEKEVFTVDEMLYALMIQSANDVATALAIHIGGSTANFVKLMNDRAAGLGMTATKFHSVHGLPPSTGQQPDVSTARDISKLALELVKRPEVFRYTSVQRRGFRNDTFGMQTHNHLILDAEAFPGCDGLKTGYFTVGGFSIAATAMRDNRRIIAVVAGCKSRTVRDAKARELLSSGFMNLPEIKAPEPVVVPEVVVEDVPQEENGSFITSLKAIVLVIGKIVLVLLAGLVVLGAGAFIFYLIKQKRENWKYKM